MKKSPIFVRSVLLFTLTLFIPQSAIAKDGMTADTLATSTALDGRTYAGQNGSKGKPADHADEFIFSNGMFRSTSCDAYGFDSGPYQTEVVDGVTYFKAVTKSPSHGQMTWQGKVDGDSIDGTFLWTKERWYWDIRKEYWLKGKLKE